MTPYAQKVVDVCHEQFPDMIFGWDNNLWSLMDSTPCSLFIAFRTKPNDKFEFHFEKGIANHTIDNVIDIVKGHAIPSLLKL